MGSKNGAVNFGGVENKKWSSNELHFVALERFELPQAEPESDVLPLHHKAICFALGRCPFAFALQSYGDFLNCANFFGVFLPKKFTLECKWQFYSCLLFEKINYCCTVYVLCGVFTVIFFIDEGRVPLRCTMPSRPLGSMSSPAYPKIRA